MTSISLPDATYQRLAERAVGLNLSVEALLDRVARVGPDLPPDRLAWLRDFDAMLAGFRTSGGRLPPDHVTDVSREAIYFGDDGPSDVDRDRAFAALTALVGRLDISDPPGHALDDSREAIYAGRGE